jgi:N-acetylneuraminic acid mutarotase
MKNILTLFILSVFSLLGFTQQLTWTSIGDFPQGGRAPQYFMIGSDIYVQGGLNSISSSVAVDDLYKYDLTSDSWTSLSPIPGGLDIYGADAFVINGMGYICDGQISGGFYNTALWQYNPSTDTWTSKATYPGTSGYSGIAFSIGQYGYRGLTYEPYTNTIYRYNSQTDVWDTIAPFPGVARQSASSFVINGVAYVGLGAVQPSTGSDVNYNDFYKYDPASGTWSQIDSFPGAGRFNANSFSLNGKGYVVGGTQQNSPSFNDVWEYDPQANTWTQLDTFPIHCRSQVAVSNGTSAIVGLGEDNTGNLTAHLWKADAITSITEVEQNTSRIWFYDNSIHVRFQKALSDIADLNLYDVSGKKVSSTILQKGQSSFDISIASVSDGIYLYSVSSQDISNNNGKLVVSR